MKNAFVFLLSVFILGCTPQKQADSTADARILSQQENYAGAIPLLKEKLQVISRIEKEYASAPAGWIDQQRAQTYTVLAYAQQMKTQEKELQLKDEIGRLQEENNELNEELNKTK